MFEIILEVRRTGRKHVGPAGLNCLLGDWYADLTVGAIAWRRFALANLVGAARLNSCRRFAELVSIPQVFLVVIDFVLDQEFKIFFLEGSLRMMFTLVANVSDDSVFF